MANDGRILIYFDELVMSLTKAYGSTMDTHIYSPRDILSCMQGIHPVDAVEVAEYDAVVSKLENLLCHATGGKYSKAGYSWEDMERMVTDYIEECCEEAVAEEVVRCKDCKHFVAPQGVPVCDCFYGLGFANADDFCSYGERKDNERKVD